MWVGKIIKSAVIIVTQIWLGSGVLIEGVNEAKKWDLSRNPTFGCHLWSLHCRSPVAYLALAFREATTLATYIFRKILFPSFNAVFYLLSIQNIIFWVLYIVHVILDFHMTLCTLELSLKHNIHYSTLLIKSSFFYQILSFFLLCDCCFILCHIFHILLTSGII